MDRRAYVGTVVGVATAAVAGCLQGDAVLHKTQISATSPEKEWEIELEEGAQMRLEVEKRDGSSSVRGYVHRSETGEEVATATTSHTGRQEFEVPATGTYVVSVDVDGATGDIRLRNMN